jgi:dihydrofolate reductase
MRKVIFGGANSLDNYLARADGDVDWIRWSDEAAAIMKEMWESIDTLVWGRKTYEFAIQNAEGKSSFSGTKSFVLSRTLPEVSGAEVTIVRDDAAVFVRGLKSQEGKDICLMCGGDLARPLLEASLIDEIGFTIHPVLLGSGVPLFYAMSRQIDLELLECRPFKNGCVSVRYRVIL